MNASQSLRRLVIASFLLFSFFLTEFLFSRPANISLFKSITSPGVAVAVSAHVTQAQRNIHAAGKQHSRTQTHTHTRPPRRHALKTKSSASRCSPRSQMRGQIVFLFFLSSYSYTYTYVPLCRARRRSELSRSQSSCARASGLRNAGSKLIARCTTRFAVYAAAAIHICPEQQQLFYSQAARRSLSPERRGIVDAEARLGLVTGPCRGLIVRC